MADQEKERDDISVEGDIATWECSVLGEIKGTYIGAFKFRCYLTPLQQIAANREYRQLLGDHQTMAPEHESFLAYSLSQLKYRIISAPPFWAGQDGVSGNLADENVITAVLDAAIGAELKYKNLLKKKKEESINKAKKAAEQILEQKGEGDDDEDQSEEDSN